MKDEDIRIRCTHRPDGKTVVVICGKPGPSAQFLKAYLQLPQPEQVVFKAEKKPKKRP